jgi:hypothetical protein
MRITRNDSLVNVTWMGRAHLSGARFLGRVPAPAPGPGNLRPLGAGLLEVSVQAVGEPPVQSGTRGIL